MEEAAEEKRRGEEAEAERRKAQEQADRREADEFEAEEKRQAEEAESERVRQEAVRQQEEEEAERLRKLEEEKQTNNEGPALVDEEEIIEDPARVQFLKRLAAEMEQDKANYDARTKLMAEKPKVLGDEWENEEEAACSQEDCPWKGPYLHGTAAQLSLPRAASKQLAERVVVLIMSVRIPGKEFREESAGCDPRSRQCECLKHWGAKYAILTAPLVLDLELCRRSRLLTIVLVLLFRTQEALPPDLPRGGHGDDRCHRLAAGLYGQVR